MLDFLPIKVKALIEVANWGLILGTLAQVLPPLAALVSLIYYSLLIYDRHKKKKKGS